MDPIGKSRRQVRFRREKAWTRRNTLCISSGHNAFPAEDGRRQPQAHGILVCRNNYLMSLPVSSGRKEVAEPSLFSGLYRPGTAAYSAAQTTRSCFQVISLGACA